MTWKPVIDRTVKSIYLSLADKLEQDIISGTLLPGTKLPPQRELADFLDINVSTVSKAFKVCELKGLLSATIGSGTFVSFDALSNVYLLTEGSSPDLIEMGATVPEVSSNKMLMLQLKNMVNEPNSCRWFNYNRPRDTLWQKDAAVILMKKCGCNSDRESILFSNGGQNAITAILGGLFKYGDKIGVDPHTYPGLKTSAAMLGIQLVPIKQVHSEMDQDSLICACRNENLKGIYIIPDHQNPTTHTMSLDCRKVLGQIAKEHNILIIEDGTYHLMSEPISSVASFAPERTVYIASLSKTVAPGLRLAYVSVPKSYKVPLSNALYNINVSVSPLMSELSARLIVSGEIDGIIEKHKKNTTKRNKIVNEYISEYDCRGDETCIFRWLYLPKNVTGAKFEALALKWGIQVYAAERFAVGNTIPEKAVRLAICAPETLEELKQGLKVLQQLLYSFK